MATAIIDYEKVYQNLGTTKEKYDYLTGLYEELYGQASMAFDITAVFSEEEEEQFEILGRFISEKLQSLREELFSWSLPIKLLFIELFNLFVGLIWWVGVQDHFFNLT